jgi:hypothetical protein
MMHCGQILWSSIETHRNAPRFKMAWKLSKSFIFRPEYNLWNKLYYFITYGANIRTMRFAMQIVSAVPE